MIVSVYQGFPHALEPERNAGLVMDQMRQAAANGAQLVVFPEMFLTGYMIMEAVNDLAMQPDSPLLTRISELAQDLGLITVVGFPEADGEGGVFNSAVVIDSNGNRAGVHRKVHLFDRDVQMFRHGSGFEVFKTSVGNIGVGICFDIEYPETARELALGGAELIVVPTANMDPFSEVQSYLIRARSRENGVPIALSNHSGADAYFRYFGGSTIVDSSGVVLALLQTEHGLVTADVSLQDSGSRGTYFAGRRPDAYRRLGEK